MISGGVLSISRLLAKRQTGIRDDIGARAGWNYAVQISSG